MIVAGNPAILGFNHVRDSSILQQAFDIADRQFAAYIVTAGKFHNLLMS